MCGSYFAELQSSQKSHERNKIRLTEVISPKRAKIVLAGISKSNQILLASQTDVSSSIDIAEAVPILSYSSLLKGLPQVTIFIFLP